MELKQKTALVIATGMLSTFGVGVATGAAGSSLMHGLADYHSGDVMRARGGAEVIAPDEMREFMQDRIEGRIDGDRLDLRDGTCFPPGSFPGLRPPQ